MTGVEMVAGFRAGAASTAGTGRRRPKGAAIKAAQFANSEAALPDLGAKDPAPRQKRFCQHLAAALQRQPLWSYAFVREI